MARHCHVGFYRRHLPHWDAPGRTLFVTWRLHGAPLPPTPRSGLHGGPLFAWRDRADDTIEHGARWLGQPEIAAMVVAALEYGERELGLYKIPCLRGDAQPCPCPVDFGRAFGPSDWRHQGVHGAARQPGLGPVGPILAA